jgi:hypothetical protein
MIRLLLALLLAVPCWAESVPLAWDASTSENIAGYKVYVGTASRSYSPPITIGNVTAYTVTGLGTGTHYFAVTAFDASGNESDYSNEVSKTIGATSSRCDLNSDGAVNSIDIQLLINSMLSSNPTIGDINADSKINVLDLQILSNVILGRSACPQ